MTLAHRTILAICIALTTVLAVTAFAIVDANSRPYGVETLQN